MGVSIMFLGQGLLLMALSVPLIRGRVKPNSFYGLRTPKSLSNERIWYPANRAGGRALFTAGGAIVLASIGVLMAGGALSEGVQAAVLGSVTLASVVAATIYSLVFLSRL